MTEATNAGPLSGIRILDLTSVVMGPLATQVLGDLGADIIGIESGRGDTNRGMGPGPHRQLSDVSLNLLRNKRNVALDLKDPAGIDALLKIAATCDVFVTNLRPGPLARLGLDYERIAAVRPDVVFCRAQGFPTDSPDADEPAYDDIVQAASGIPDVVRRATGLAAMMPILLADKVSGLSAHLCDPGGPVAPRADRGGPGSRGPDARRRALVRARRALGGRDER